MITLAVGERSARFLAADGQPLSQDLALGPATLAERWLRHDPPTPGELEAAIEGVEDRVMPLHGKLPETDSLLIALDDASLIPLRSLVRERFTRDELEDVFNRAAAIVLGRPASSDPQLANRNVLAGLLVLREAMHHLGLTRGAFAPPP